MTDAWTIYAARGLRTGLVKIGRTQQPLSRLRFLGLTVEALELLATYTAPASEELALHRRFAASLARGREWFRETDDLRAWLSSLPPDARHQGITFPGPPKLSQGFVDGVRATREDANPLRAERFAELFAHRHGHPFVAGQPVAGCSACDRRAASRRVATERAIATRARRALEDAAAGAA